MNVFDKGKSNDGRLVWHEGAHAYLTALGVPQSYQKNHSAHLAVDRFARIQARRKYRPSEEDSNIGYCSAQARRAAAYTNCMKDAAGNPFAVQGTVVDPSEEQATSTCSDVQSFSNLMMGACQAQVSYCPGDGMDNCCSSSSGFGRAVADPSGGQGTPHPWAVDPTEEDSGTGIPIIDFGGRTPPPGVPGGGPTPPDDEDDPTPGDPSSD